MLFYCNICYLLKKATFYNHAAMDMYTCIYYLHCDSSLNKQKITKDQIQFRDLHMNSANNCVLNARTVNFKISHYMYISILLQISHV